MTGPVTFCHFFMVTLSSLLLLLLVLAQQPAFLPAKIGLAVLILVVLCPIYPAELGSTSLAGLSRQKYSNQPGSEGKCPRSPWAATQQLAAKAASKELPSKLQVAPPPGQGSQLGLQARKQLSSHQQLPRAAVPPCQHRPAPERAISWVRLFSSFLALSFMSYSSRSTAGGAFAREYCTAQMLKVTPFSLVPLNTPAAERSPQQQHAACQVALLTQSMQCFPPPPPDFPQQEQHHSNTLRTGTASLLTPEPMVPAHHL